MRVLLDAEKLDFVRKLVSWIEGKDILDTCFILNFGYEAPLPWPQVLSFIIFQFLDNIVQNIVSHTNYLH